jgi:AcrR family transcriptional regulator
MISRRKGEVTRQRILDSAIQCFSESGYDKTAVAKICQTAGISKGAFYHHFSSKQALFLELLNHWLKGLDVQIQNACAEASDVPNALAQIASMVRQVFEAGHGKLPMFLAFLNQAALDEAVWSATISHYRRYQEIFEEIIRTGIEEGSLAQQDPAIAARTLVSLGVGLVLQGTLDSDITDWGMVTERSIQLLLKGLLGRENENPVDRSLRQCGGEYPQ